jgi:hypothetical protein
LHPASNARLNGVWTLSSGSGALGAERRARACAHSAHWPWRKERDGRATAVIRVRSARSVAMATSPPSASPGGDDVLLFGEGGPSASFGVAELREAVHRTLDQLGPRERVLIVPPDFTRAHSQAGIVTKLIYDYYGDRVKDILPALGSHDPMTIPLTSKMFAGVPPELFRVHDWRNDVKTLGVVDAEFVAQITDGKYSHSYPVQMSKLVHDGGHDLIISVGQVVPHEVAGMANHTKNILVGCGGGCSFSWSFCACSENGSYAGNWRWL